MNKHILSCSCECADFYIDCMRDQVLLVIRVCTLCQESVIRKLSSMLSSIDRNFFIGMEKVKMFCST